MTTKPRKLTKEQRNELKYFYQGTDLDAIFDDLDAADEEIDALKAEGSLPSIMSKWYPAMRAAEIERDEALAKLAEAEKDNDSWLEAVKERDRKYDAVCVQLVEAQTKLADVEKRHAEEQAQWNEQYAVQNRVNAELARAETDLGHSERDLIKALDEFGEQCGETVRLKAKLEVAREALTWYARCNCEHYTGINAREALAKMEGKG